MDYLLYYKEGKIWNQMEGIYKTEEEAKEEIKEYLKIEDFKIEDFTIIPNDGKAWKQYRPLDTGDRIYY